MKDFLIVGAGLFGATIANILNSNGKSVTVIDKRNHIAGNAYTELKDGIHVHKYGAHIFHTDDEEVWKYINKFAKFNNFINSPIANYKGEIYSLPFNMYTFNKMWGLSSPIKVKEKIKEQSSMIINPKNLEEQAISLVGIDAYTKLIKEYTEKQWGRKCSELPCDIIKRLPVRLTFDNNYFNSKYQGIPEDGYTDLVSKMLEGIEVKLNTDYLDNKEYYLENYNQIIYTGQIDRLFDYKLGKLKYRSLRFDELELNIDNYQGNAVVNYTSDDVAYTRIIEHKMFDKKCISNKTIISYEYPIEWNENSEPYYPINDKENEELFHKYLLLERKEIIGGRLGLYKYYDMDQIVKSAINLSKELII